MVIRKRIIKLAALFFITAVIMLMLMQLMVNTTTSSELHIKNFYKEPENTLDVALIGCSEMYADYSAPLAYKECGFTSYNLCYESAMGCMYPSMIREFCSRQDPQLTVIEVNGFFYSKEYDKKEASVRRWVDSMEKNDNWKQTIQELVEPEERINYYFNFLKYHSNWNVPEKLLYRIKSYYDNSKTPVSMMKSFGTRTTTRSAREGRLKPPELTDIGEEYMKDTIACCKELGLEQVLFIRTPHMLKLPEETDKRLRAIAEESGYSYFNFETAAGEMGIDESTDYYNNEHLNVFGSEKFTKYIARYLCDNYTITADHSDETDAQWKECVEYTENAFKILGERTLDNEDYPYYEYTDLSEKEHERIKKAMKVKEVLEKDDPDKIKEKPSPKDKHPTDKKDK